MAWHGGNFTLLLYSSTVLGNHYSVMLIGFLLLSSSVYPQTGNKSTQKKLVIKKMRILMLRTKIHEQFPDQ